MSRQQMVGNNSSNHGQKVVSLLGAGVATLNNI